MYYISEINQNRGLNVSFLFVAYFLKKILKTYAAIQIYPLWAVKASMFSWKESDKER